MKVTRIFFGVGILLAGMLTTACQDDLAGPSTYNDGKLHLKFAFDDEDGQWNDDGTPRTQTRLMTPVELSMPDDGAMPLYLHCVETNTIETSTTEAPAVTRGERLTGEDIFKNSEKIKNFGLYARIGNSNSSDYEVLNMGNEIKCDTLKEEGDWKTTMLNLPGDTAFWTSKKTGYFYGFAPFPGPDSDDASGEDYGKGHARCIMTDFDSSDQPTITFTMQPEEEKNKDILTAKKETPYSASGMEVEMKFRHVLTALKFNLYDGNDLTYVSGIGSTATTYYMHIKSIELKNVYRQGTAPLGGEFDEGTHASHWTPVDEDYGSCKIDNFKDYRTRYQINGDADKAINNDKRCFMVLPQITPPQSKLVITADLTTDAAGENVYLAGATFEAKLGNETWKPGYTYTYSIKKDAIARNFALTVSGIDTTTGVTFASEGGDKEIQVASTVTVKEEGKDQKTDPASWHLEYSEDDGATWHTGLPLGYALVDANDNAVSNVNNIPGSLTAVTYTLIAEPRGDVSADGLNADASPIRQMQMQGYVGEVDGYYDLSTHGLGYGAEQTARNTANCYIVAGHGKFQFPLVYGNAIKQGVDNPIAYKWFPNKKVFTNYNTDDITSPYINVDIARYNEYIADAVIVWQDHQGMIRQESLKVWTDTNDRIDGTTYCKQYLRFEVNQNDTYPGNAVLAVKNSDGYIVWSWHIWLTNQDFNSTVELKYNGHTMNVAKYNLGWRDPEVLKTGSDDKHFKFQIKQNSPFGQSTPAPYYPVTHSKGYVVLGGSNLAYQHGRKDPFPNSVVDVKNTGTYGDATLQYELVDMFDKLADEGDILDIEGFKRFNYTEDAALMGGAIKRPTRIFRSNASNSRPNWLLPIHPDNTSNTTYGFYNLWDPAKHSVVKDSEGSFAPISKTIYDPSPVGFVVPGRGFLEMITNLNGSWVSHNTITMDGKTMNAPIPWVECNGLRLYRAGIRRRLYDGNSYDTKYINKYKGIYTSGDVRINYNLANFWADGTDNDKFGFIWTAGLFYGDPTNFTESAINNDRRDCRFGVYVGISAGKNVRTEDVGKATIFPIQYGANSYDAGYGQHYFFPAQMCPVRPIKDVITEVEKHSDSNKQEFKQETWTTVQLKNYSTSGRTQVWGLENLTDCPAQGGGLGLSAIVSNTSLNLKQRKAYIRNIKVTFADKTTAVTDIAYKGYNGLYAGVLRPYAIQDFYATYDRETYEEQNFCNLTDIDASYTFSYDNWHRASVTSAFTEAEWKQLLQLEVLRLDIVKVEADIRVSYIVETATP